MGYGVFWCPEISFGQTVKRKKLFVQTIKLVRARDPPEKRAGSPGESLPFFGLTVLPTAGRYLGGATFSRLSRWTSAVFMAFLEAW